MTGLVISSSEENAIDMLANRLICKPLTKTKVRGTNLSPQQIERIRRACIWGYTPEEICNMFPFADLAFVLDQKKSFNHRLRARFQIPVGCRVHMCMVMNEEGKSIAEIAKLMSISQTTVKRYLTEYPYSPLLARTMRHWSEILEALNGPRPLNVNSPIYKATKTAKADEKSSSKLAKSGFDKDQRTKRATKRRLSATRH
ncbi:helix-turn-helix domain-containing protein [Serratia fonticola]|jgi:predicted transcriptional regulator|uniref:helix-turn-helix domain-containing protein n=1 Tax=Serratia fonticola TaxID=47917 RepID=UPI0027F7E31A|nr:helix-turn-helix domain-containing protein [Serratia fonticola]MDQ7209773.1 helix-turn-helix domain-containing protein [Serratia fonticola]HBE9079143.1 helix-turn-helix domain-containing protein [Serratia fonticola]